jgi:putative sterol carrier protein
MGEIEQVTESKTPAGDETGADANAIETPGDGTAADAGAGIEQAAGAVAAAEFARSVSETPDAQLAEGLRSEFRGAILDEIFRRMGEHVRPDKAEGLDAVIHWSIGGGPDGGADVYEVVIREGACRATREPRESPRLTFKIDGVEFLKLVTGNASGPVLFMQGKLGVHGDLLFATRVAGLFTIPAS